jgi:hypothetical protein
MHSEPERCVTFESFCGDSGISLKGHVSALFIGGEGRVGNYSAASFACR